MAVKVNAAHLVAMRDRAESLMKRASAVKGKAEQATHELVRAAEIGSASFAMGVVQGRYGAVEVLGVPVDLLAAAGLHAVGFLGLAGKASKHLHAFGNGALASYLTTLGRGTGLSWKSKSLSAASVQGDPGARLTEKELRALAGQGEREREVA